MTFYAIINTAQSASSPGKYYARPVAFTTRAARDAWVDMNGGHSMTATEARRMCSAADLDAARDAAEASA